MKKYLYLVLFLLINTVYAQDINPNQVKVAYVYNFLKNIAWKDEAKIESYKLLVVSDNKNIKNLFSMLASRKPLKQKNIELVFYDQYDVNSKIHAAYIDDEHAVAYEKLFDRYESQNVLLISDQYSNKKQVMINLLSQNEKITFEINKANILNQGLEVSPNMILLGGTEIDVAKLYKSSQHELKAYKSEIEKLTVSINEKNIELKEKIVSIGKKNQIVSQQQEDIKKQEKQLLKQKKELETIYQNIQTQRSQLQDQEQKVKENEELVERLINLQIAKNAELSTRQEELKQLNEEIAQQKDKLVEKEGLISKQQSTIGTLSILVVIIILLGLYGIRQNRLLRQLSQTDALSSLYNRRFMNKRIDEEIMKYKRYQTPFSMLLIDIDHFKEINDTYGHDKGDLVIKKIAKLLQTSTRNTDICARWGGEEFMILAVNTDLDGAKKLAENLRVIVNEAAFEVSRKVTISTGVSTFTSELNHESMIKLADTKLYHAKEKGRDRVEF